MGVEVNSVKNGNNAGFAAEDISFVGTTNRNLVGATNKKKDDFSVGLRSDVIRAQRLQTKKKTGVKDEYPLKMQLNSDDESKGSLNTSGGGRNRARQNVKNSTAQPMNQAGKPALDPKFKIGDNKVEEVEEMDDEDFSESGDSVQGPAGNQTGLGLGR